MTEPPVQRHDTAHTRVMIEPAPQVAHTPPREQQKPSTAAASSTDDKTDVDAPDPMTDDNAWHRLHDSTKVAWISSVLHQLYAALDAKLAEFDALTIEVEDPEGLARLSVGYDGRLLSLFLHDALRSRLTNIELEQKLAELLAAAYESLATARHEITDTPLTWSPPPPNS